MYLFLFPIDSENVYFTVHTSHIHYILDQKGCVLYHFPSNAKICLWLQIFNECMYIMLCTCVLYVSTYKIPEASFVFA